MRIVSTLKIQKIINGARSTRYAKIKRLRELGVLEETNGKLTVNYFSPYTWRILYEDQSSEYVVLRAVNVSGGVLTGMRIVGQVAPNPYSDAPIYEVYVPRKRADVFSAILGLRNDILVFSNPKSLLKTPLSKTLVLAYDLNNMVDYEEVRTPYGFSIGEASIEQALIDVIRNDYWYYRGIAFEVYYYARRYIDLEKTLEIAKRTRVERRLLTIDYVVSEVLGENPLFTASKNVELDKVNLVEITDRLGDILD